MFEKYRRNKEFGIGVKSAAFKLFLFVKFLSAFLINTLQIFNCHIASFSHIIEP